GPKVLEQAVAFPGETGLAAASAITGNLLGQHPGLKLAFSHGGGTLAMLLPRLAHARASFPAVKNALTTDPLEQARQFFYDTLVYDPGTLQHLITTFGVSQLMLGTDYPFAIMDRQPIERLEPLALSADQHYALRRGNAMRFLGHDLPSFSS